MRFIANGPDIPSDLLYARDEGDVIFFCGAGVSRAEAGGPSFKELAERVVTRLGSSLASPARQLLKISDTLRPPPGVGGMPPADRIFALLEQEFAVADVRAAVAEAVKPIVNPGLEPHRSLLDLSLAPDGGCRLVTTNFDRVFQLAMPDLKEILPPTLPDPRRSTWEGIVHLHGMVTKDYTGAASEEFILSSADFGRAYLADGWATGFMRALMERYRIVFIGYSADDPPIQYLLEALSRTAQPGRLYAFHPGDAGEAAALWRHKGVTAIPFGSFSSLWTSLGAWATRARDPEVWRTSIIARAVPGPRPLTPEERGQVAHIVSSEAGARAFAMSDVPPSAEWLCVFDPAVRYSRDRPNGMFESEEGERLLPFDAFHLDGDLPPLADQNGAAQTNPPKAWSAFEEMAEDVSIYLGQRLSSLRGQGGSEPAPLSRRLDSLSTWIGRVAAQGVSAWWAAGQRGLHPWLVESVRRNLDEKMPATVRHAWRLILSAEPTSNGFDLRLYDLARIVKAEGWSEWALRELARFERPRIVVERAYTSIPLDGEMGLKRMLHPDVAYPGHLAELVVPPEHLSRYVRTLRGYIESAAALENDVTGFFYPMLRPITPYDDPSSSFSDRGDDLPALVRHMADQMQRLEGIDAASARREMLAWPGPGDQVFRLLHVWALGRQGLFNAAEAGQRFVDLSDDVFWDRDVQRDLLVSVATRWTDLPDETCRAIEGKILKGPDPWDGVDPDQYSKYHAHRILSRLEWFDREGLKVDFDLGTARQPFLEILPHWTTEDADEEIYQSTSRGGWVATDTEPGALIDVPIDQLLDASEAASGRTRDPLVERKPFRGVSERRPVRALAALVRSAKNGETRREQWSDFLWQEARLGDPPRLKVLISKRLVSLPDAPFLENLQAIGEWTSKCGRAISLRDRHAYLALWDRTALVVAQRPDDARSSIVSDTRRDWLGAAINSPGGRIASLLCEEFSWEEGPNYNQMDDTWRARAQLLLTATRAPLCHVAAVFGTRLNWLYHADPAWTDENVIYPVESDPGSDFAQATLVSLLSYGGSWSASLFTRLKDLLVLFAGQDPNGSRANAEAPIALLRGWRSRDSDGNRLLSNERLREALLIATDDARVAVLRTAGQWSEQDGEWTPTVELLEDVWPRQLVARTPAAASALAGLAMSAGESMPRLTRVVLPLLSPAAEDWTDPIQLRPAKDDLVERFAAEHLAILDAALGDDPTKWAYGAPALIKRLSEIDAVKGDSRLARLKKRMGGR